VGTARPVAQSLRFTAAVVLNPLPDDVPRGVPSAGGLSGAPRLEVRLDQPHPCCLPVHDIRFSVGKIHCPLLLLSLSPSSLRRSTAFFQPPPHQPLGLVTISWRTKTRGLTVERLRCIFLKEEGIHLRVLVEPKGVKRGYRTVMDGCRRESSGKRGGTNVHAS